MKIQNIAFLIGIYFIILQMVSVYFGSEINTYSVLNFSLFQFGIICCLVFLVLMINRYLKKGEENKYNSYIITLVLFYLGYQYLILSSIHYFQNNVPFRQLLYFIVDRSYLIIIPLLYWYVFPFFNEKKILLFLDVTCFVLVFGFAYNYSIGLYEYTSTGELRIASGVATIPFCYLLIRSFSFFSGEKNNYIFLFAAIVGLIFTNHRSAYLGVFLLLPISILNTKRIGAKSKYFFHASVALILVVIILSQFPLIAENFLGRVASSTDIEDPNLLDREKYYVRAFNFFLENPINGSMKDDQFYSSDIKNQHKIPPHNFIFQILSTQGLVGFFFIFAIISMALRIAFLNRHDNISFQMFLVLIFYLFFSLLNYTFLNPSNLFILLFTISLIMYRNMKNLEMERIKLAIKSNYLKSHFKLNLEKSEK